MSRSVGIFVGIGVVILLTVAVLGTGLFVQSDAPEPKCDVKFDCLPASVGDGEDCFTATRYCSYAEDGSCLGCWDRKY